METVKRLSHIEHVLLRPSVYVGSVDVTEELRWIRVGSKFSQERVWYPPALLKIFDEILVNALDRNTLFPMDVKMIAVSIDNIGCISVENTGPLGGIAVEMNSGENMWNPELTFGHLLTSTNYNDDIARYVGGQNGYGAKLANIFSSKFAVVIKDSINKKVYTQSWSDNMHKCEPPIIKKYVGATSSVCISFTPDWGRFNMGGIDADFYKIIEKRVWDSQVCTSKSCKLLFQGSVISKLNFKQYCQMYLDDTGLLTNYEVDDLEIGVAPSTDGFKHVSFVNGLCTTVGGTHVDVIVNNICRSLDYRPSMVKNALFIFVKARIVNPSFSSQLKTECTSKMKPIPVTSPTIIKKIMSSGVNDILSASVKLKDMKELKKTDGSQRKNKIIGIPKLDDANLAGTGKSRECTLIITEGDSAKTLAVAGLSVVGRDRWGVFPLRGKCKNVRDASMKQLVDNQEFSDLKKIIGLQQEKRYTSLHELRYGRLMIMTDADNDGSHIKGLILNMFHFFWPNLLELGFIVSLVTPILKATKNGHTKSFYTESSFRDWWGGHSGTGWKIKYYKGLGTSTSKEAQEYFKNIDRLTVGFSSTSTTTDSITLAFDKKMADDRKQWLLNTTRDGVTGIDYGNIQAISVSDFIYRDLVNFSLADLKRSIAHLCDGLKPSQRKVLYTCFTRNIHEEVKVAQLASIVSEKTSYHHGEVSLAETIVKLAQNHIGSNNINLLHPGGQFGTRLMGGKDASQSRYIFTHLRGLTTRILFPKKDDPILTYLKDDGKDIEPEYYIPIIPMILVNGTDGIGTGFSSSIPPFNAISIIATINNILRGRETVEPLHPWFRGFRGNIVQTSHQHWVAEGVYSRSDDKITITELPPGRWTQDYKEYLDTLIDKGVIKSYVNKSTIDHVHFDLTGCSDNIDLKLSKSITTTNMHLFHPVDGIKRYATAEEIIKNFIEIRLKYYEKRRGHWLRVIDDKISLLENKMSFIKMVVAGSVVVFMRKKSELVNEMTRRGFTHIDKLLEISTYQYTEDYIKALQGEIVDLQMERTTLFESTPRGMYKKDIKLCNEMLNEELYIR